MNLEKKIMYMQFVNWYINGDCLVGKIKEVYVYL